MLNVAQISDQNSFIEPYKGPVYRGRVDPRRVGSRRTIYSVGLPYAYPSPISLSVHLSETTLDFSTGPKPWPSAPVKTPRKGRMRGLG